MSALVGTPIEWLCEMRGAKTKKVIEHKMRVLIYTTTFAGNISHSKNNQARYNKECT